MSERSLAFGCLNLVLGCIFSSVGLRILAFFVWMVSPFIFFPAFVEYDNPVFEKSGKGGTYPRRYGIPFGLQDYSDGLFPHAASAVVELSLLCVTPVPRSAGRKTFPRARRTQVHGFRSPVSFSPTEQSPSTSSGSSVFTPDLEEVPGPSRRPRRGSDIEPTPNPAAAPTLSVMDISPPSRCE